MLGALLAVVALHVLPNPASVSALPCPGGAVAVPSRAQATIDPGALEELNERWTALGLARVTAGGIAQVRFRRDRSLAPQAYDLRVEAGGVSIASADADGAFNAVMTLAQLPVHGTHGWRMPCVHIADAPALQWRILSDDVSRGPLPTMRYFEERIRTIAAFKMNGYSPYMEHVFISPTDPLPAPLDGITPAQLSELQRYAARFHVAFIPEQQTFAHMHNTLRLERYASAAEFPHGFLIAPGNSDGANYLARIINQELHAVHRPPFFHIGADETATLGEGATQTYVAQHGGRGAVYAQHVREMANLIAPSGARVMLWDDGIEADPSIMAGLPKDAVIVNWHYGTEPSYAHYITTIARGGFAQMVAPGANNWNEIYPDIAAAIPNERRFIDEGKAAHVLGLFQTVWHDDGETLFEATWYPVLYAASAAWESRDVDPARFRADFPAAFFGADDRRYGDDIAGLSNATALVGAYGDKRAWANPFDPFDASLMANVDLATLRHNAEDVEMHLIHAHPPLHANAARVMFLAARRYDLLGRRYQIAREVSHYYADALVHGQDGVRDLFWCKYWFWELRDADEELAPLYADAWRYEDRESHLQSNLERYHLDAQQAIRWADAVDRVTYEDFVPHKTLPDLDAVLGVPKDRP
ncbi:MAG TPA: glycoside hydrolase family 20 zincin-like fold domain-containing protein [Candidatus Baltobacteraceae bacterium]|jgi:hypothetical protein|nr:glycoside hydrolase family 20 zincin-like fold domain-containing protein [Candidatus Baltobacteraceae bacterium]